MPALALLTGAALMWITSVGLGHDKVPVSSLVQHLSGQRLPWKHPPRFWLTRVLPHSPELLVLVLGPRFSCSHPVFLGWGLRVPKADTRGELLCDWSAPAAESD